MGQLEREENLKRFGDSGGRLLMMILMATGLRVGDGCRLALDCIVLDGQGAPYLRYRNHKMRRDAVVPIDLKLAEAITIQQNAVATEFPMASTYCPVRRGTPMVVWPSAQQRSAANWSRGCWPATCVDQLGRPVHVTRTVASHLWDEARRRRRPAGDRAAPPRPRLPRDDLALCRVGPDDP